MQKKKGPQNLDLGIPFMNCSFKHRLFTILGAICVIMDYRPN